MPTREIIETLESVQIVHHKKRVTNFKSLQPLIITSRGDKI